MITAKKLVLMDVDTQEDFVSSEGAFGAQITLWNIARIVPNLARIFDYAAAQNMTTLLPTDAHVHDDPEFTDGVPAHCVVGTSGHNRIPQTDLEPTLVIENRPGSFSGALPEVDRLVVKVLKQHFAVGTNPNFAALIEAIGPCHVLATGVATQEGVKASIQSLLDLGVSVSVVVDAVGPDIYEEPGRLAIEELVGLGVATITTDEVCAGGLSDLSSS
jgi:nicotinamidase-related amidase